MTTRLDPKLTAITIAGLRLHAGHLEVEGFLNAARHMRDAAELLEEVVRSQDTQEAEDD